MRCAFATHSRGPILKSLTGSMKPGPSVRSAESTTPEKRIVRDPGRDITVIVATRNRARHLERMLKSIERQAIEHLDCEVIVVANRRHDETQSGLKRSLNGCTVVTLYEERAGKARALN